MVNTEALERGEVAYAISEAVAEQTGSGIRELPPLYETVDPEALDAFLRCSNSTDAHSERSVEFSYCGRRVTVESTGGLQLRPETESKSSDRSA